MAIRAVRCFTAVMVITTFMAIAVGENGGNLDFSVGIWFFKLCWVAKNKPRQEEGSSFFYSTKIDKLKFTVSYQVNQVFVVEKLCFFVSP